MSSNVDMARDSELTRSSFLNSTLLECYMGGLSLFLKFTHSFTFRKAFTRLYSYTPSMHTVCSVHLGKR
jgi:hypothetical protein